MPEKPSKSTIILMGPPGSGKSTLGLALGADYVHISTGDLVRAEIAKGTELGKALHSDVAKGALVPSATVSMLVSQRLAQPDVSARSVIIDGFPRTVGQVDFLRRAGIPVDIVVVLHCDKESLINRISNRRIDPKTKRLYSLHSLPAGVDPAALVRRADDEPDVLCKRYETYKKAEQRILRAFRCFGKGSSKNVPHIVHISADQAPEAIVEQCKAQIGYYAEMKKAGAARKSGFQKSKL